MSSLVPKKYKSIKTKSKRSKSHNKKNELSEAIEECKKLYHKYYSYPTPSLLNQLNKKYLKLFFEHLSIKDITILSQILSKFYFLQSIQISPNDPEKPDELPSKRNFRPEWIIKEEKKKKLKEKKIRQGEIKWGMMLL